MQSDTSANEISEESKLRATNLHMHGLTENSAYALTINDIEWITAHFNDARQLLEEDRFQTAVHCLASYRWHSMPRVKLAVLWAGIEGMFGASSEIRFRISLYIARFLHASDSGARKELFDSVKKLYNSRSKAVHGAKIKGDLNVAVEESAEILRNLIKQCAINKSLPNEDELVP
ncbi:HEPN domain-containing protein [Shewanella marina]|uniref:HEPN domain-containing protein n=1 Tax=Shewanella marina TaxID=487319 RepID=UPI0004728924|nr:HEPN domain-containing protein [Shewanella marina]